MRCLCVSLVLATSLAAAGCVSNPVVPRDIRREEAAGTRPHCRAARTIRALSRQPEVKLDSLDKLSAVLTTPFKEAGVSGWKDTGCNAEAVGVAVRDAQESSKNFWTLDVQLDRFEIAGKTAPAGRFIRIEIWPETRASTVARNTKIRKGARIAFGGPVLIDDDGPFLEVHPDENFRIVSASGAK